MKKAFEFFGGRKVLFALILTGVITAMVFLDKATIDDWTSFMKWVFVGYVGGNAGEHVANALKK